MGSNGQLWHRVQLQSVDFAKRECTLADGPITISHYPIVLLFTLCDSVGCSKYSYSP